MGSKKIEDYLHLYLGCRCMYTHQGKKGLINIHEGVGMWRLIAIHHTERKVNLEAKGCIEVVNMSEVKPILRPLSDMKEEDYAFINDGYNNSNKHSRYGSYYWESEQTKIFTIQTL